MPDIQSMSTFIFLWRTFLCLLLSILSAAVSMFTKKLRQKYKLYKLIIFKYKFIFLNSTAALVPLFNLKKFIPISLFKQIFQALIFQIALLVNPILSFHVPASYTSHFQAVCYLFYAIEDNLPLYHTIHFP